MLIRVLYLTSKYFHDYILTIALSNVQDLSDQRFVVSRFYRASVLDLAYYF